ncbi:MAG: ATP-binding cassette domain-containing protein [Saprospiraceae bacterium]|nr:ATP-binding cassette domain-containing protein [Saprospiraceae bacterium]
MSVTNSTTDEKSKTKLSKETLKKAIGIFRYIRPYIGYFAAAMFFLVVGSLIFMALMGLPGEMANTAVGKPKFNFDLDVKDYGWVFLVILIVQGVLSYLRTYYFAIVSEKGMADLRKDLYNKIITQPVTFFEERRVGELTSRITADVEQLQSTFSITLAEFIRQVVIMVSGIAIIIFWTPSLSFIMLLTFPAIVIVAVVFGKYIRKLSKERQDQLAHTNTIVEETFQSFSIVKSFANEWYESIRYGGSVDDIVKISLRFAKIRGIFFVFIITILFGGIFFILWRGALMVQNGTMEAGDLFSFIIYTGILGGAIASFGNLYTQLVSALGATERILEILDSTSEIEINQKPDKAPLKLTGDIQYQNVVFSYPTRKDVGVLKGITIDISAGQKIALVGQSGSGKSTIVQLLMKFYNPDSGQILVDGKNINDFDLTLFRQNIGIVPQEVMLFGGTIKENIAYGKPGASIEEIKFAAQQSNSLEFIEAFPDGLETIVGERGIKLSGGQRQRIAIARAILKDPKILILDEATSSLDAESEKLVQEALDNLMKGRTSIIIAHRLSTIREVDCIYVLENGRIIESGTHDYLSALDGAYNSFAKLQFDNVPAK